MKLISIIVPAYNVAKYLPRCLDSILEQTYKNLQIIVVDDGSTDDLTPSIVDEYAKKDSRIVPVHQENMGLSGARNTALKMAGGEYVGYVDGDDYIAPTMYEELISACESHNADIAVCGYQVVGEETEKQFFSNKSYLLTRDEALDIYISDSKEYHIYNSVWSKLFKRELVKDIFFPIGHNSEDIMYTTRALATCKQCVFVDKPLYFYLVSRSGSIMNDLDKMASRRFQDELPFWREQIAFLQNQGMDLFAQKAAYFLWRRELFYYMEFKHYGMEESAKQLADIIIEQRQKVQAIYQSDFVSKGDFYRMKLFLKSPNLFYRIMGIYEDWIVPIKSKRLAK